MKINEFLEDVRFKRHQECFTVINRGKLWYDSLTKEQICELTLWYNNWLNITEVIKELLKTNKVEDINLCAIIPTRPSWIGVE